MATGTTAKNKEPKAVKSEPQTQEQPSKPEASARTYFSIFAPEAQSVSVAGSFNDWQPEAGKMDREENGNWSCSLDLQPGTHEYCIVVDGNYQQDPNAASAVDNPFGGKNSVLEVAPSA